MLPEYIIYIAALLNLAGCGSYLVATLRGKAQPNRTSWLMWTLISIVTTFAQWFGNGGLSTIVVLSSALGPFAVFIASFMNTKAYWKTTKIDVMCGILSCLGLIGWSVAQNPSVAIIMCILADWLANAPTIRKAWIAPDSENPATYALGALCGVLTVASIPLPFTFNSSAFMISFMLGNVTLLLTTLRPRLFRITASESTTP